MQCGVAPLTVLTDSGPETRTNLPTSMQKLEAELDAENVSACLSHQRHAGGGGVMLLRGLYTEIHRGLADAYLRYFRTTQHYCSPPVRCLGFWLAPLPRSQLPKA
jgi:hypothetical protein